MLICAKETVTIEVRGVGKTEGEEQGEWEERRTTRALREGKEQEGVMGGGRRESALRDWEERKTRALREWTERTKKASILKREREIHLSENVVRVFRVLYLGS